MPRVRTAVTAGDHHRWMTTSPEATPGSRNDPKCQKERPNDVFLISISVLRVLVDLCLVMLPLFSIESAARFHAMATAIPPGR